MPPPSIRLPAWLTRLRTTVLDHDSRHEDGGLDEIDLTGLGGMPGDLAAHATRHEDGGADEMALAGLDVSADDVTSGTLPGIRFTSSEKSASYTATSTDLVIYVDADARDATITLPAAASHTNRIYYVKKVDGSGNRVLIDGNAAETIDGEPAIALTLKYAYVLVHCDGDEWHILGGGNVKLEELITQQIELLETIRDNTKDAVTHLFLGSDEQLEEGA